MSLTQKERLQACLANDPALDRPPVALWRHFPVDDQSPDTLAAAVVEFQQRYVFDMVKVTPASSFCLKDWGVEDAWEGNSEGTRRYTRHVIHKPEDWEKFPILDPRHANHLRDQLSCLRMIRSFLGPDVPILQTIFNPLAQAKNLAGSRLLLAHLRQYPEAVMKGLETIAETTRRFIEEVKKAEIDGVFYAVQHAQAEVLTLDKYQTFCLPFDRKVLEPAKDLWCNLVHLHGSNIYFDLADTFQEMFSSPMILNWHDRETPPTLKLGRTLFSGIPCGGISQITLSMENHERVRHEAEEAIQQTGGRRFILGTGCVVPIITPHGNIMAARKSVEGK